MRPDDLMVLTRLGESISRWNHPDIRELSPAGRATLASVIADSIRAVHPVRASATPTSEALARKGVARLPMGLSREAAAGTAAYFAARPCLNKHVADFPHGDDTRRPVDGSASEFAFGCYDRDEVLAAPNLLELFTREDVLDTVELALGARPMIFSVNAYWSFPQSQPSPYGQEFHRDKSHSKFVVLFLYLTDTDAEGGAHEYFKFTHDPAALAHALGRPADSYFQKPMDGRGFCDLYLSELGALLERIDGPAGTAFLTDAYGLHRGKPPSTRRRLLAWARYSLFAIPPALPRTPAAALGSRLPTDERARYALRGVVEF